MAKRQTDELVGDVPVRIPIPAALLEIADPKQRRDALEACWKSYGYSDRFTMVRIQDGHFIMVRKGEA